ncbi:hypothetical protein CWI42_090530 [Ordospora colligata]|uniref:Uncharacterized protein n=1 Tax=Ordospora colligata OC4 TaxID=1354746 RepID=A0A0B2UIR7_9MICR|nr:uncharacterized protein M896_090530 [Ordospora colligata OC4]KHN69129.1 hypothetical protein M896_090530 [Ordospora colligata OC4]TBU14584.1 hypothetical protein CWI41_090530 [Ordospora colligata]TBU14778.1 hypothetical protein CWI40_090540 [Ordospora colligata]TBU18212.1 hypothetical protein CWI42_090530 [Ordospora colligata]
MHQRSSPVNTTTARPRGSPTRLATPFTLKCLKCSTYIHKNKRHNAFKETAHGKDYLGVPSYRFNIKCTACKQTLSILTDPKNGTYIPESGCVKVEEQLSPSLEKTADMNQNSSNRLRSESNMKDQISTLLEQSRHVSSASARLDHKDRNKDKQSS